MSICTHNEGNSIYTTHIGPERRVELHFCHECGSHALVSATPDGEQATNWQETFWYHGVKPEPPSGTDAGGTEAEPEMLYKKLQETVNYALIVGQTDAELEEAVRLLLDQHRRSMERDLHSYKPRSDITVFQPDPQQQLQGGWPEGGGSSTSYDY